MTASWTLWVYQKEELSLYIEEAAQNVGMAQQGQSNSTSRRTAAHSDRQGKSSRLIVYNRLVCLLEEERILAGEIVKNPEMMAFSKKVYCPEQPKTRTEIESSIAMPDEVYGQSNEKLWLLPRNTF